MVLPLAAPNIIPSCGNSKDMEVPPDTQEDDVGLEVTPNEMLFGVHGAGLGGEGQSK